MKINIAQIMDEIISEYSLKGKARINRSVYIEIRKGMYGLPQASMLQTNYSNVDLLNTDIMKYNIPLATGDIHGDLSILHW